MFVLFRSNYVLLLLLERLRGFNNSTLITRTQFINIKYYCFHHEYFIVLPGNVFDLMKLYGPRNVTKL
jgi:hypothetical protein